MLHRLYRAILLHYTTNVNHRPHAIPSLLAAAFLLLATLNLPYGYYTFLRIVVTTAAVYVAYCGYKWGRCWALWTFAVLAVLFNPLIPVHLTKAIWLPVDLATAAIFVLAAIVVNASSGS